MTRRPIFYVVTAVALALLLSAAWLAWRADTESKAVDLRVPAETSMLDEPRPTTLAADSTEDGSLRVDVSSEAARAWSSGPLEGRVLTADGGVVPDALLTWTALKLESALPIVAKTFEQRDLIARDSSIASSDATGHFKFESTPLHVDQASVLWVTAAGMEGMAVPIDVSTASKTEPRLVSGLKRDVRVVDSSGRPAAGALVEQFGAYSVGMALGDPWKSAAGMAFRRTAMTDEEGRPQPALYSCTAGESIQASLGGAASDTWIEPFATDTGPIVLVLSPSFSCYGQVTSLDQSLSFEGLVVDARAYHETSTGSMATALVRSDGTWGPLSVPCREGWEYSLFLRGSGAAHDRRYLGRPAPGDQVRADFAAVAGMSVPVKVVDERDEPIGNVACTALWSIEDFAVTSASSTDADGLTRLLGVRAGWVQLSAEADGYTPFQGEWLELSSSVELPLKIEMAPARKVWGRVVREGAPVENFKIVWWSAESIRSSETWDVDFEGRKDGAFQIESAPRATVWLMASAEGSSRSGFVRSEVDSDAEILLELQPSCRATGRVVDARSGEGLGGATVELYMNRGNQFLRPRHAPVVADMEGRFTIEDMAPGDNRLVIEAAGYSRYLGVAFGTPNGTSDIGAVPMQVTRELVLVLSGEEPVETSAYSARLKGTRYHGPVAFDSTGTARFDDVSPGVTTWTVLGPNEYERSEVHALQPDAEWIFEVEVARGPALEIEVVSPSDVPVPHGLWVTVSGSAPSGPRSPAAEAWISVRADDGGLARVRGLRPGPVAVLAIDVEGNAGAAMNGVLEPNGSRIEVPWIPNQHTFRVLDPKGQPVSEADVFLCAPNGTSTWTSMFATNDDGEVAFGLLPYDDVLVGVKHPELGMLPARPFRLSQESGTTTLRYGDIDGLDLLLLEGGLPSVGTQVSLFTGGFRFVVGDVASDGEGRLRWPNVAEGQYSMRIVHPGFWPGHALVPTSTGADPTPVTIYRSGAVVLKLVTGSNSPLAGQALEIEHVALGEGPTQWAALGLLPSAVTVSDGEGRIVLDGWPRGTYRWRANRPDGALGQGEFELAPGANPEIELRIP